MQLVDYSICILVISDCIGFALSPATWRTVVSAKYVIQWTCHRLQYHQSIIPKMFANATWRQVASTWKIQAADHWLDVKTDIQMSTKRVQVSAPIQPDAAKSTISRSDCTVIAGTANRPQTRPSPGAYSIGLQDRRMPRITTNTFLCIIL